MATRARARAVMRSEALPPSDAARDRWMLLLLLAVAVLAVFGAACGFELSSWDDAANLTQNPWMNARTLSGLGYFWTHAYERLYIPLTYTVWWVLAQLSWLEQADAAGSHFTPYLFHTANVAAHMATVLTVYQLLKLLVGRGWPAAVGAALFAFHPMQVETVAWATGLKDLLGALLSFLAMWQLLLAVGAGAGARPDQQRLHVPRFVGATALFLAALLAKPSAVSAPLMLLIVACLLMRLPLRRMIVYLLPWLVLALLCVVWTRAAQVIEHPADGGRWWLRPLIATDALAFYLTKLVAPLNLCLIYHHSPQDVMASGALYMSWILPAGLGVVALLLRRRAPWVGVGYLLMVAGVLPVLGLAPFHFQSLSTTTDHYLYPGMLGVAVVAAFGFRAAAAYRPRPSAVVAIVVLTLCAAATERQLFYWSNSVTLFRRQVALNPGNYALWDNYATALQADGDLRSALDAYGRAEKLASDDPIVHVGMASLFGELGQLDAAEHYYRLALQEDPQSAAATDGLDIVAEHRAATRALMSPTRPTKAMGS